MANVILFGLAVLAGEWLAHQLAYLIEYGSQFSAVMEATPHRYYMAPASIVLAAGVLGVLGSSAVTLQVLAARRARLVPLLPQRLARHIPEGLTAVPSRTIAGTTLALAAAQISIYVLQENLEAAAEGQGVPGAGVLVGAQHVAVLPLHGLMAFCFSLLLWRLATRIHTARRAEQLVTLLLSLVAQETSPPPRYSAIDRVSSLRLRAGTLGLRSPPHCPDSAH